jgi:pimeloyl-ACP methyl ester carboxylesterase
MLTPARLARAERAFHSYDRTVAGNPWVGGAAAGDGGAPHPKQQRFLLHADTREVFYGGAGGGGRARACGTRCCSSRVSPGTPPDLRRPGQARGADGPVEGVPGRDGGATWNERDKQWRFPSGGKISFGYLQHEDDKLQYKSAEFQYIAFDELTDFTVSQYTSLFTRLRKKKDGPLAEVQPLFLGGNLETKRKEHIWASPLYWVTPDAVPTLCIHGADDRYVAHEQSAWVVEKLRASAVEAELLTLPGAGHGFKGKDAETAEAALVAFFDRHLKAK